MKMFFAEFNVSYEKFPYLLSSDLPPRFRVLCCKIRSRPPPPERLTRGHACLALLQIQSIHRSPKF